MQNRQGLIHIHRNGCHLKINVLPVLRQIQSTDSERRKQRPLLDEFRMTSNMASSQVVAYRRFRSQFVNFPPQNPPELNMRGLAFKIALFFTIFFLSGFIQEL